MVLQILTLLGALGMFLYGMNMMSSGLQKVAGERLRSFLAAMTSNPFKRVLTGLSITAIIQSSSASVGILQALANSGAIGLDSAVYVLFGQNIGTCITAVLAKAGVNYLIAVCIAILFCACVGTVNGFLHTKMMELFRLYLVTGGMPAAVSKYLESNNLQEVMAIQQDIIRLYKRDIAQYDPDNKLYIEDIFDLIPPELNAKNKRFILKRLNENAKFERFRNSFLWLKNAGVAIPVYNVEEPKMPLLLARSRNLFKLFQSDIGLLAAQYAEGIQLRIIKGDKDINFGSIYENAVAQELTAHSLTPYYYNNKKRGEIDFVIETGGKILPIEVKSGKDYETHHALSNIMDCGEYELDEAIVLNNENLYVKGKITYAPIYMIMFLQKKNEAPAFYKIDLSGIK